MTPKILLSATALVVLTLSANAIVAQEGSEAVSLVSPKYGTWGFDVTGMDLSVKPGDDFFRYANGKWADRTEIPSDRTGYGNFTRLAELSEDRIAHLGMIQDVITRMADEKRTSDQLERSPPSPVPEAPPPHVGNGEVLV